MKKVLFVFYLLILVVAVQAQGIVFEEGTLAEAFAKAKSEDKIVFLDISTSWCAPCKRLAREVFTKPVVASYYNATFVNYKLDGESKEGKALCEKYGVKGFPSLLFLDAEGKVIYRFVGFRDPAAFLGEAEKVPEVIRYGGWDKMNEDFKAGNNDPGFLQVYYQFVDKKDKPLALNAYLKSLPDEKLFSREIAARYEDITIYDPVLFNRLVDGVIRYKEIYTDLKPADYNFYFIAPLEFRLTRFLDEYIKQGDKAHTKEMMALEKRLRSLGGFREADVQWARNRGTIFMSDELIHLIFARKNDKEGFMKQLPAYMEKIMAEIPADKVPFKMNKDLSKEDKIRMFNLFSMGYIEMEGGYFVNNMFDFIDYYWRNMPSDKATKTQCAAWVNYLCSLNPYDYQNPFAGADLLIRFGQKKQAVALMENLQQVLKSIDYQDETLAANIQQKIWEIRNDK